MEPGGLDRCTALLLGPVVVIPARTQGIDAGTCAERVDRHPGERLGEHIRRIGSCPDGGPWLIDVLEECGLTGRGGGHFATARKWRSALEAGGAVTVVANGAESEPFSAKDATLLTQRPHLVLDGLACAAQTVRAQGAVVWLHGHDRDTRAAVGAAVGERDAAGMPGPPISIVAAPDHYLSGESSAIARALSGDRVLPTFRAVERARPTGGPVTVVQNVETLARVALAARRHDPRRRTGAEHRLAACETTLLTVAGAGSRVVLEVDPTATLRQAVGTAIRPAAETPAAVLLGGFGGTWARWDDVAEVEANEVAVRAVGATLGAGIVAPIDHHACGVAETAAIARYLADSSAGQCGPCVHGLAAVAESLEALRRGSTSRRELRLLRADLEAVRGRGACHHPDGAVRMVTSALDVFRSDVVAHAAGTPCPYADRRTLPVPRVP